ncbi:MAG: hypothetical protein BMS9Abin36_0684 [Gammaproteobacteria bacterium]|nr:MAG: hypothetical protein BMS9Abin36_0684 [Gammaproteobacteria bacterium]
MQKTLTYSIPIIVVVLALVFFIWRGNTYYSNPPDISHVEFTLINGKPSKMSDYLGKPLFVTFWATTCRLCIKEIPDLKALYKKWRPRGLELIAVAMPYDPPANVLIYVEKQALPYPVALDIDGKVVTAFGDIKLTPTHFLIDNEGQVIFRIQGLLPLDKLNRLIGSMLNTGV